MNAVETHEYQCPCDMCEPEAHSVAEFPERCSACRSYHCKGECSLPPVLFSTRPERPTAPPSSRADAEARAFEALVKSVGEGKARWSKLLELLEEQAK